MLMARIEELRESLSTLVTVGISARILTMVRIGCAPDETKNGVFAIDDS